MPQCSMFAFFLPFQISQVVFKNWSNYYPIYNIVWVFIVSAKKYCQLFLQSIIHIIYSRVLFFFSIHHFVKMTLVRKNYVRYYFHDNQFLKRYSQILIMIGFYSCDYKTLLFWSLLNKEQNS